ncbi:ubiquitin-2 like Rad60 SUMO-like-domain-containing protein [Haematococcus lacustris]
MAEGSTLHIKFRTTNGDVGPLSFSDSQTVQQAKEKLWAEWPKEGPLSKEAPSSPNDIRLILGGKYVDAGKTLKEYRKDMGDIGLDSVVFFHMIVRPVPNPAKAGGAPSPKEEVQKQSCACVIC